MKDSTSKGQYQFELWEECNSHCKFCYLGSANNKTPDDQKLANLSKAIERISDRTLYDHINCLAYIGGEFFQGQLKDSRVKQKFMELMSKTAALINDGTISSTWISATLMIGQQADLYECLSLFKDLNKVWILTSYDTIGRFHSTKAEQMWKDNLQALRRAFPQLNINITSILTGDFIDKYLNGTLDIQRIAEESRCAMFWKPPCSIDRQDDTHLTKLQVNSILPNFFPLRHKFLSFLLKYKANESDFMYDKLFNMQYRSEYLEKFTKGFHMSHRLKDKYVEATDDGNDILSCGHSGQYQIYADSDACAICDKEKIRKMA